MILSPFKKFSVDVVLMLALVLVSAEAQRRHRFPGK